ncbi:D-TA family PLP-dependent enzyme [Mucilaginibacter conchicola]|uniref:D-TA family PLP-dependent enzyme n=1 Tax=Mucilaginibacter conchicola TaxID=2303333 RepID=A0A372NVQ2_9SPHI|nr:D-TA family PLP-dependent enzyme [Mucilaginibacter conchicola]RFZ94175.1 D-TA family PLP-dependent enzyme [Mucilaginibacter conchicola]
MEIPAWYIINNVDELDTPALIVYPDRVKSNIDLLKSMVDDPFRLRPHAKSHKSADAALLMIQSGISKFKCATIAEAEMLGIAKATDVLLAYQPAGPKLQRFIEVIKAYPDTTYSCLVDNDYSANVMSKAAIESNLVIPVYIDLNVGMNRTGLKPKCAFFLFKTCSVLPGLRLMGLHAYDGHIHDDDFAVREQRVAEALQPVHQLRDDLVNAGYAKPLLIAGGSPTMPIIARLKDNVELSPGTFVYWDKGYGDAYPEQPFQSAALLVARVISLPEDGKICIDLGHKSVSAERPLNERVYFLNAPELKFISHSEEHLVADAGPNHNYKVGDVLYGLPFHVCPSVALYERAITIENNQISGQWKTIARDRKITI